MQRKPNQHIAYEMIGQSGPDHDKTFTFRVTINGVAVGEGSGSTKKEAEQMAAKQALEALRHERAGLILPVFVPHLGCPHACVFCNQRRISGSTARRLPRTCNRRSRARPPCPRTGAKRQLAFYGGSFTAIPREQDRAAGGRPRRRMERGRSIHPPLHPAGRHRRRGAGAPAPLWRGDHRAGRPVHGRRGAAPLRPWAYGRGRGEAASGLIQAAGFRLILQMMTGLPGDSGEESVRTARELIALQPDGVRIYPTVIVRGTELFDLWQRGEYREHTVEDAVSICARLVPLFETAGIPVIRLGLNPTEELSGGEAAAGAYHPALGELVKSRICWKGGGAAGRRSEPGSRVILGSGSRLLSQMIGPAPGICLARRGCGVCLKLLRIPAGKKSGEILWFPLKNQRKSVIIT